MQNVRQTVMKPDETGRVSEQWLAVLDLGIPGEPPGRDDALAVNVLARLADCMP
jgi:hypothetical protein